ncbi:MAG: LacI family transcriptional regulator [Actinobacteria bacterium]|nr:LacI family transcriptional regulator [Actinomycetota bacterium]
MPTIQNVAKLAGVSPITVSRVINNSGYVRRDTRKRVEEAIAELRYVPNALARSLRSKQTNIVALILTDVTNPFWTTVARGVEDVADKKSFSVILCNTDEDVIKEANYINVLLRRQVDGIIIAPARKDGKHLRLLKYQNVPCVIIDRKVQGFESDSVRGDSLDGAYQLIKHLISLGHSRIALIGGPSYVSTAEDRLQGYLKALQEHGLPLEERLILRGEHKQESGYRLTKELLAREPWPTAIFAVNNFIAVGVLQALREAGLSVPDDMALVCFDDIPQASLIYPFLTVVAQPAYEMGTMAAQMLLERLASNSKRKRIRQIIMKPTLIIRESCGSERSKKDNIHRSLL